MDILITGTMKGMIGMDYFTAAEVQRFLSGTNLRLCTGYDDNPNREAFDACVRFADEAWSSKWGYTAYGFQLGYATGVREERARRAGKCAEK
jgi:hypothetical protein